MGAVKNLLLEFDNDADAAQVELDYRKFCNVLDKLYQYITIEKIKSILANAGIDIKQLKKSYIENLREKKLSEFFYYAESIITAIDKAVDRFPGIIYESDSHCAF